MYGFSWTVCVRVRDTSGWFVAGCYADKANDHDLPVGPFSITSTDPYPVCASYCMDKVCNRCIP